MPPQTINEHLKAIFDSNELNEISIIQNFRIVKQEENGHGHNLDCYNLDVIVVNNTTLIKNKPTTKINV